MDRAVLLCPPVDVMQISSTLLEDSRRHSSLSIKLATYTAIVQHGIEDVQKCQEELITALPTSHFMHAVTFQTLDPGEWSANFSNDEFSSVYTVHTTLEAFCRVRAKILDIRRSLD